MGNKLLISTTVGLIAILALAYTQGWIVPSSKDTQGKTLNSSPPAQTTVKRVLDPLTIETDSGHIVRYIGVRTPTVAKEVQCFGKEALLANESVIGKKVRLEEEPLLLRASDGAWTRYVFIEEEAKPSPSQDTSNPSQSPIADNINPDLSALTDAAKEIVTDTNSNEVSPSPTTSPTPEQPKEILINERILEGGFGFPVVSQDMKYGERMLAAARFASATGKGLWSRCEVQEDSSVLTTQTIDQCIIKGKVGSDGSKLYRTPNCPAYEQTMVIQTDGGQWFCAEDIAQDAGFTKASDCP